MSRRYIRTLSRSFPSYHPRKNEPTYFVEKLWKSIGQPDPSILDKFIWPDEWLSQKFDAKHHTIRAGHHIKQGDIISFRVWSGKPYRSKQIIIAPDIEVKKVWNFKLKKVWQAGGNVYGFINGKLIDSQKANLLAENDGLSMVDFTDWFIPKKIIRNDLVFDGQIICWNENINY